MYQNFFVVVDLAFPLVDGNQAGDDVDASR
jgi:hypothetical protein